MIYHQQQSANIPFPDPELDVFRWEIGNNADAKDWQGIFASLVIRTIGGNIVRAFV